MPVSLSEAFARAERRIVAPSITLHDGQREVYESRRRFNVLACGRRWGKTRFGVYLVMDALDRGELVGWFAPTYRYADDAFEEVVSLLGGDSSPLIASINRTTKTIRLRNGGVLECWTLENKDAGRSRKYHLVIVDEAAMVLGLGGIMTKAILPTVADYRGNVWLLSTPRGSSGYFFEAFRRGQVEDNWASWQKPSSNNPYIPPEEIELARDGAHPTVFAQEWLAEFVQPAGAVYDVFDHGRHVVRQFRIPSDWPIYLGVDFGSANTAWVLVAKDPETEVYYLTHCYHASGDPSKHVRALQTVLNGRRLAGAWGGSASENAARDDWRAAGLPVMQPTVTGPGSVEVGINKVYALLAKDKLKVFATARKAVEQFLGYSYKVDPSDRVTDLIEEKAMYHVIDAARYVLSTLAGTVQIRDIGRRIEQDLPV